MSLFARRKSVHPLLRAAVIEVLETRQMLSTTLAPIADTFVRDGSFASSVYGSYGLIAAKQGSAGVQRQIFQKFDLSSVSGTISHATLSVYGDRSNTNDGTFAIAAAAMTDNSWTEAATTWNNKPAFGSAVATVSVTNTVAGWINLDVTGYLQQAQANGQAIVSMAIVGTANTDAYFEMQSREGANPPQLVITTDAAPAAPTGLSTSSAQGTSATLTWTDNSTNETGFQIQRKQGSGAWSTIATTAANTTSYLDNSLTPSTTYSYQVAAVNGTVLSAYSNTTTVTTTASTALTPTADTFVRDGTSATAIYGSYALIQSKQGSAGVQRQIYLKFDLTNVSGSIDNATLRLFGNRSNTNDSTYNMAAAVVGNDWSESTTDWNNKPTVGTVIDTASVMNTAKTWIDLDVSSYLQQAQLNGQATVSIAIVGTANTDAYFEMSSREGTNPAQLVLTTAPTTTNATPTVATPAAANPNPISGTTANLSVLGADDGGESNLTYTWSIASKPPGAANPSFSVNGTNASKNTVVTFTQAGTYAFLAVISDGHTSTDSSVSVVVDQTVTSIALTPKNTAVGIGGVQQFAAGAIDQFGQPLVTAPTYTWSVLTGAGTISSNGLFTAGTTSGSVTVRAASGNISDTATITVSNSAPSVATPANVSDDPVTGTIANLDVLGADDGGESQLVYTWSVANKPAGSSDPTFSNNGTNASKSTVATFNHEGVYGFLVTISDGALSTTSSVNVTVAATPTTVSVTPATTTLTAGASQNFAAAVSDQFNNSILSPSVTWSVISGGGSFAGNTYTAGPAGSSTVQAKSGTAIGTAIVVVGNALPTAAIIDDPNNVYVSASTLTFSAQANDPDGEDSLLNYEWSVFREGVPVDLGNAEIHSASFSYVPAQDGNYDVRLNVTDSVGGSVTKDDDFAVGSAGATAAVTDDVTVRDANAPVLIDVLANDIAPAGDTLSISGIPQQGTHGTASIVVGSPNKISYVPDTDFAGQDSFTYQIRDRYGATNSGSVNVMVLPGGGSSITAGNLAGTQNYVINDGFDADSGQAFVPQTQGNYSFTSSVSRTPDLQTITDNNGNIANEVTTIDQTVSVISTLANDASWTYSETVMSITTIVLTPLISGKGISQTETKTDKYNFSAYGDTATSNFSLNSSETDLIAGSSAADAVALNWTSNGEKTAAVNNSTNLLTGVSTGNTSQYGSDTYSATGTGNYSYTVDGGAVSGVSTQNSSWGDTFNYTSAGGSYVEQQSNNWSYAGNGLANQDTTTSGTLSASDSGSFSNTDSSNATILESGHGSATDTYTLNSALIEGVWVSSGTGISHQDTHGGWTSIAEGSYTHTTTSATGNATMSGSTNATQNSRWDSDSNLNQVLGIDGNWTVSAGTGNSSGTNTSESSYEGSGSFTQDTVDAGTVTGASAGSYSNSNHQQGQTTESGENESTSTYSILSGWADGAWNNTGSAGNDANAHGELTSQGTGSYSQATTSAAGNNSDSGSSDSSEVSKWDSNTSLEQTLGADGNWVVTSGISGSSGDDSASSTYTGTGAYASNTSDAGSLSTTGTYRNTTHNDGTTSENGKNQSTSSYSIQSNWSGASWTNNGTSTESDANLGHWSSSGTGSYTNTTNTQNSLASLSGTSDTTQNSDWNSDNTIAQVLGADGNWTVSSGTGHSSGNSISDSSYSGANGTLSYAGVTGTSTTGDSGDDGEITSLVQVDAGPSGHTTDSGTSGYTNSYNIQSTWSGSAWVNTGSSHETDSGKGDWEFTGAGDYSHQNTRGDTTSTAAGVSHTHQSAHWTSSDDISQTLGAGGTWSIAHGSGTYTGQNDNSSTYSGSGSVSQADSVTSGTPAGSTEGISSHADYDRNGPSHEEGSADSSSTYSIQSDWSTTSWVSTGTSSETDTSNGSSSSTLNGFYDDSTTISGAETSAGGNTGKTQIDHWDSSYHYQQSLNPGGTWVTQSGTGSNHGDTLISSSYSGAGDYSQTDTHQTGALTGGASGSYDNSGTGQHGTNTESGSTTSSTSYVLNNVWSPGTSSAGVWATTGSSTDTEASDSDYSLNGTGTYHHSTTTATGNSSVDGGTEITHTISTHGESKGTQTFVGGTWTITSGKSDSTGHDGMDSSYHGAGNYADGRTIKESGSNSLINDYDLKSTWAAAHQSDGTTVPAGWYDSGGEQTATTVDGGQWAASSEASYTHGNVSGTDGSTVATSWNVNATVEMSLAFGSFHPDASTTTTESWVVTSGSGESTGGTRDDWTYSGTGTDSTTGDTITEGGHAGTFTSYDIKATWDATNNAAKRTGTQTTSTLDEGSYSLSGSTDHVASDGTESINSHTKGQSWSEGTTATQTYGAQNSWIYTSTTSRDTYTTIDAQTTSSSGSYTQSQDSQGDVPETATFSTVDSTVSTQSFASSATLSSGGGTSYDGTGVGAVNRSHSYHYNASGANSVSMASYADLQQSYKGKGQESTTDNVTTNWTMNPSGTWGAQETTEALSGHSGSDVTTTKYNVATNQLITNQESRSQDYNRTLTSEPGEDGTDSGNGSGSASGTYSISGQNGDNAYETETDKYKYSDTWAPDGAGGTTTSGKDDYSVDATFIDPARDYETAYYNEGTQSSPGYSPTPPALPGPSEHIGYSYPSGNAAPTAQGVAPSPSTPPLKNPAPPAKPAGGTMGGGQGSGPKSDVSNLVNLRNAAQAAQGTPNAEAAQAAYDAAKQQYLNGMAAGYDDHIRDSVTENQSFLGSITPVLGNRQAAINSFATGHYGWGLAYTGLAVTDIFVVKSLVTGAGKAAVEGVGKAFGEGAVEETGAEAKAFSSEASAADCGTEANCFIAGTEVLLGDGKTEQQIQNIHVGERVATDGGVANSADGKTASADPDSTAVDPKTWRLITVESADGDWQVQSLEPESWIESHAIVSGKEIELSDIVDLREMGTPDGIYGTVESVTACPTIETGTGRVVLTTVNHLNGNVFDLTLTDASGTSDTIGITGYHKVYTEDRGWVNAEDLVEGEQVRSDHGDVIVATVIRDPGSFRVYNMTVESDHVYFVGDLSALVHNVWCDGTHHVVPKYLGGTDADGLYRLPGEFHQEVHRLIDRGLQDAFADMGAPAGRYTAAWNRFFDAAGNEGTREAAQNIARKVLVDFLTDVGW